MRQQVKLIFQIGVPSLQPQFFGAVIRMATQLCGGCTTSTKDGWWREGAEEHGDWFFGELQREVCYELELTCEMHKAESAMHIMQRAIAEYASNWGVDTNWVHVTQLACFGRHFSVKAVQQEMANRTATQVASDNAMRMQMDPPQEEARAVTGVYGHEGLLE